MTPSFRAALRLALVALTLGGIGAAGCRAPAQQAAQEAATQRAEAPVAILPARVVREYPHDPGAFTQGLFVRDGVLFESTGLEGSSSLREVDLATGKVRRSVELSPEYFGEGSVDWGPDIISLTWKNGVAFRWDARSFAERGQFRYAGEGWGLTQDGQSLILSDGTSELRFLDPATFQERRRLRVTFNGQPLTQINELEWVEGEVWANLWHQDLIARIDPASGRVTGLIDLSPVVAQVAIPHAEAVANGIAYDRKAKRLFVTGKNWPKLFEIAVPSPPG
jgi:glutamine cyclotransferase